MDADLLKPFKFCFLLLKALGLWQDGNQTWIYFVFGYFFHFVMIELYIVGLLLYIPNLENLDDWVDLLRMLFVYLGLAMKCFNFFLKIGNIKNCYKNLECLLENIKFQWFNTRQHIKKRANQCFRIYIIFWACDIFCCIGVLAVVVFSHKMPNKLWFPFDTKTSEVGFWIGSLYLVVNAIIGGTTGVSFVMFPLIFICFAVGLIEELAERLREVKKNEELIECIKVHIKIKEFVKEIHENFAMVILTEAVMSSTEICVSAFILSNVSLS